MYDVIVIGVGAAGSSAGIYIARARLKTLMIGDPASSRLARAHSIDNYLGFPDGISGSTLIELGFAQAQRFGAEVVLGEVVSIKPEEPFAVELATGERFESASIVLATGTSSKSSGIKNETELTGRGVSYCVTCDAFFYRGKRVVVIGDGNFAAKETLELLPFTRDVTLCSNGKAFEISDSLRAELAQVGVVLADYRVSEFLGNEKLEGLRLTTGETVPADGVFIAMGTASSLDFARTLGIEIEGNAIVIDREGHTNFPGIFAAGDCTGGALQAAKAVGEGCVAGLSAVSFVRKKKGAMAR